MTEELKMDEKAELGLFARIFNVFIAPSKTYEDVKKEAKIIVPALILGVFFLGILLTQYDLLKELSKMQIQNAQALNPQIEVTDEILEQSARIGIIVGAISAFLTPIIKGVIVHGLSMLFDGEGEMKNTISALVYSYYIVLLGRIISGIIALISNNAVVNFSPALFLDASKYGSNLYNMLSFFDVFSIWYLIVSVIAIKIIQNISYKKSAIVVLLPTLVLFLMTLIPALLT